LRLTDNLLGRDVNALLFIETKKKKRTTTKEKIKVQAKSPESLSIE
jgi:hypothetical protein